jgi:hypothetical protein
MSSRSSARVGSAPVNSTMHVILAKEKDYVNQCSEKKITKRYTRIQITVLEKIPFPKKMSRRQ